MSLGRLAALIDQSLQEGFVLFDCRAIEENVPVGCPLRGVTTGDDRVPPSTSDYLVWSRSEDIGKGNTLIPCVKAKPSLLSVWLGGLESAFGNSSFKPDGATVGLWIGIRFVLMGDQELRAPRFAHG